MDNDIGNREGQLYLVGKRGYSAYEVAVQNGFVGTEEEWLASLKGEKGDPGTPFDELTPEQKAEIKGDRGYSSYEIAVQHGFIGTEEEWVNSFLTPDGYYNKAETDSKLSKKPYYYNSVADMKADNSLKNGDMAITLGYYAANDGGGAEYKIRTKTNSDVDDGGSKIVIGNLVAELIVRDNTINVKQFGAKGDGVTDDFVYLKKAHSFANSNSIFTVYYPKARYYVLNNEGYAIDVFTNIDFGGSYIIIDDRELPLNKNKTFIWNVISDYNERDMTEEVSLSSLSKYQNEITELANKGSLYVTVTDENKRIYIRKGENENQGDFLNDRFRVNNSGFVLDPIIWDFTNISSILARQIDDRKIILENGVFETIINEEDTYDYYNRGFSVNRDYVTFSNMTHLLSNQETQTSSPYNGFICVNKCVGFVLKDSIISGHKVFRTETNVYKGTYDISFKYCIDTHLEKVTSVTDITDRQYWSMFAGNYNKKIYLDGCILNRFGSHQGFWDFEIKNSIIGCRGMGFSGGGLGIIENVEVKNALRFVDLKADYGSSFEGTIKIINCSYLPDSSLTSAPIIEGPNDSTWNFGYKCYFPNIYIDNFLLKAFDNNSFMCYIFKIANLINENIDYSVDYESNILNNCFPQIMAEKIICKNMKVENTDSYYQLTGPSQTKFLWYGYCEKIGKVSEMQNLDTYVYINQDVKETITTNCYIQFENVALEHDYTTYSQNRCSLIGDGALEFSSISTNDYRCLPYIFINQCDNVFLGMHGRTGLIKISNSDIYLIRSGDTNSKSVCYFDIDNSTIHFHYFDTNYSHRVFSTPRYNYELLNCSFDIDTGVDLDDIKDEENPFKNWNVNSNWIDFYGKYTNSQYWASFSDEFEANSLGLAFDDYGYDKSKIITNEGYYTKPRQIGTSSQKPSESGHLHILSGGTTYYDTTNTNLLTWNGSSWV